MEGGGEVERKGEVGSVQVDQLFSLSFFSSPFFLLFSIYLLTTSRRRAAYSLQPCIRFGRRGRGKGESGKGGGVEGRDGGMEGWRDGGMEGWRDGGMEGWRDGGMEGWRDGGREGGRGREGRGGEKEKRRRVNEERMREKRAYLEEYLCC